MMDFQHLKELAEENTKQFITEGTTTSLDNTLPNLKFSDVKSADGLVTIGQKLTWDAVNNDGVENITYSVYKDNVLLHEGNSLAEYTIEKGSATALTERNGNYQVKIISVHLTES